LGCEVQVFPVDQLSGEQLLAAWLVNTRLKPGVDLTDREREMLRILAAAPGETVPRLSLAGQGGAVSERAVDVQVNRLRRKIERNPANPLFVQTVRGVGYRLVITS